LGADETRRFPDAITVDKYDSPAIDIVFDINKELPFLNNNSVDEFHSTYVLEHINERIS
jgi:predicted SAM-dependent methyltransferase